MWLVSGIWNSDLPEHLQENQKDFQIAAHFLSRDVNPRHRLRRRAHPNIYQAAVSQSPLPGSILHQSELTELTVHGQPLGHSLPVDARRASSQEVRLYTQTHHEFLLVNYNGGKLTIANPLPSLFGHRHIHIKLAVTRIKCLRTSY